MMQPLRRSVAKSAWKWDIGLTSAKASVNTFIGIQEPRPWNENFKASIPLKLSKIILFLFQKWIPDISIEINVIKIFNKIKIYLNKNIWWRMSKKIGFRIFFSIELKGQHTKSWNVFLILFISWNFSKFARP